MKHFQSTYLSASPFLTGIRIVQYLVFCVMSAIHVYFFLLSRWTFVYSVLGF